MTRGVDGEEEEEKYDKEGKRRAALRWASMARRILVSGFWGFWRRRLSCELLLSYCWLLVGFIDGQFLSTIFLHGKNDRKNDMFIISLL